MEERLVFKVIGIVTNTVDKSGHAINEVVDGTAFGFTMFKNAMAQAHLEHTAECMQEANQTLANASNLTAAQQDHLKSLMIA